MILSIIAAMSENRVIGRNNKMPWDLPSDRKRFHATTRDHPVIMGRKTYESIGKPLSRRTNIILTRQRDYRADGCIVVHDIESALAACEGTDEAFVCGGEEIFRQTIGLADRVYLTVIRRSVDGDAFFPELPAFFNEAERNEVEDVMPYTRLLYRRAAAASQHPRPDRRGGPDLPE